MFYDTSVIFFLIQLYWAAVYLWIHRTTVHSLSLPRNISLDTYPPLIIYSRVDGHLGCSQACYFNDSHLLCMVYRAPHQPPLICPFRDISLGSPTPLASLCQRLFHCLVSEHAIPFAPRIPCAAGLPENS